MKKNTHKIKLNKNKGILFWITGLSGSGKTSLAKKIHKDIEKKFGKTIIVNGDDLRKIFDLKSYTSSGRKKYLVMYNKFCKSITDQNINLIFAVVGLYDFIRRKNKLTISNYVEIFIKADLEKIINSKRKIKIYNKKENIVGVNIQPEFPKKPDIIIKNDFKRNLNSLKNELIMKLGNLI